VPPDWPDHSAGFPAHPAGFEGFTTPDHSAGFEGFATPDGVIDAGSFDDADNYGDGPDAPGGLEPPLPADPLPDWASSPAA